MSRGAAWVWRDVTVAGTGPLGRCVVFFVVGVYCRRNTHPQRKGILCEWLSRDVSHFVDVQVALMITCMVRWWWHLSVLAHTHITEKKTLSRTDI